MGSIGISFQLTVGNLLLTVDWLLKTDQRILWKLYFSWQKSVEQNIRLAIPYHHGPAKRDIGFCWVHWRAAHELPLGHPWGQTWIQHIPPPWCASPCKSWYVHPIVTATGHHRKVVDSFYAKCCPSGLFSVSWLWAKCCTWLQTPTLRLPLLRSLEMDEECPEGRPLLLHPTSQVSSSCDSWDAENWANHHDYVTQQVHQVPPLVWQHSSHRYRTHSIRTVVWVVGIDPNRATQLPQMWTASDWTHRGLRSAWENQCWPCL